MTTSQKKAGLTPEAFDRFLGSLDIDRDRAGEKYENLRLKLLRFFEWRGALHPDLLADETLERSGGNCSRRGRRTSDKMS
jgi:hypothetical protein